MIFNKKQNIFILLSGFFICSCGLQIGEMAPDVPKYQLSSRSGNCSQINYKKVFMDYFFTSQPSSETVSQAFGCISDKIREFRDLMGHEVLNKQQVVNVLNQDFIQKNNIKSIIDNILAPEYFYNYLSIKDSLIQLVNLKLNRDYLRADWICEVKPSDKHIISKKEVGRLINFLGNLSELFFSVEESAQIVFEEFFEKRSISKLDMQNSNTVLTEFSGFLSDHLFEVFPSYSQFLKNQIAESHKAMAKETMYVDEFNYTMKGGDRKIFLKEVMAPLLEVLNMPPSEKTEIDFQNVKYMMLNIYIMRAFFQVYDLNQDFRLSSQELKSLSCLVTPLVSVLISSELKKEWEIIQDIYNPTALSHYIINYQRIPSESVTESNFWGFWWFRIRHSSDRLNSMSYTEVSRLISMLFSEFFNKIQFEEL